MCVLRREGAAVLGGRRDLQCDPPFDRVATHRPAGGRGKQWIACLAVVFGEPGSQHRHGSIQRYVVPSAHADLLHLGTGIEHDGVAAEAGELRDPWPSLDREQHQRVVAPAGPPGPVAGVKGARRSRLRWGGSPGCVQLLRLRSRRSPTPNPGGHDRAASSTTFLALLRTRSNLPEVVYGPVPRDRWPAVASRLFRVDASKRSEATFPTHVHGRRILRPRAGHTQSLQRVRILLR